VLRLKRAFRLEPSLVLRRCWRVSVDLLLFQVFFQVKKRIKNKKGNGAVFFVLIFFLSFLSPSFSLIFLSVIDSFGFPRRSVGR